MAQVKVLFVDYDGTLHDSDAKFAEKFDGLFGMGGEALWNIFLNEIHRGIVHRYFPDRHDDMEFQCRLLLKRLNRPYDGDACRELARLYFEALEECWTKPKFFDDAASFLKAAFEMGYRICLTTGSYASEKAKCLESTGLWKYFAMAIGEESVGCRKSSPGYFEGALRLSGASPSEAASVGDSYLHDVVPAKLIGMRSSAHLLSHIEAINS